MMPTGERSPLPPDPSTGLSSGSYVVGIDGGGTSVRVAVAELDGQIIAQAKGPGINPNSGGDPRVALTETIAEAFSTLPPQAPKKVVAGFAGLAGALTNPKQLGAASAAAWKANGVGGHLEVVSDQVVAFWSGVELPSRRGEDSDSVVGGRVLIAGTGAVAALVHGPELKATVDGYGYLLGDRGGGVWLGVEAVRAALDGYCGRGPSTVLTELVFGERGFTETIADAYQGPARDLGKYSRFIDRAAEQGDEVALRIVEVAAQELKLTVDALPNTERGPIVLVGSIAAGQNPVADRLRTLLTEDELEFHIGGSGLTGAVNLAITQLDLGRSF